MFFLRKISMTLWVHVRLQLNKNWKFRASPLITFPCLVRKKSLLVGWLPSLKCGVWQPDPSWYHNCPLATMPDMIHISTCMWYSNPNLSTKTSIHGIFHRINRYIWDHPMSKMLNLVDLLDSCQICIIHIYIYVVSTYIWLVVSIIFSISYEWIK